MSIVEWLCYLKSGILNEAASSKASDSIKVKAHSESSLQGKGHANCKCKHAQVLKGCLSVQADMVDLFLIYSRTSCTVDLKRLGTSFTIRSVLYSYAEPFFSSRRDRV